MDHSQELALLDRLNERIGKHRPFMQWAEIIEAQDTSRMGMDRGLFIALLEIADMRREIENSGKVT